MIDNDNDWYDAFCSLPLVRLFKPLLLKHREIILYLFFGGLAFFMSVGTYSFFFVCMNMNVLTANIVSWIITVLFAFFTNRVWVFESKAKGFAAFFKEMFLFYAARLFTLAVEEAMLFVLVDKMRVNGIVSKIIAQIVVIVLNYVLSKIMIFRKSSLSEAAK